MSDPVAAVPTTGHELLLGLAGWVDDDLLGIGRELVAVGEETVALELLTASLSAGRMVLPHPVRVALADAVERRLGPEFVHLLPPGGPQPDDTGHRFVPNPPFDGPGVADVVARIAAVVTELPVVARSGARTSLTWRLTPAGSSPGPVPHPVLLAELADPGPAEVLAYQLGAALARAGVPVSVESFAGNRVGGTDSLPPYHRAALAASRPLTTAAPRLPATAVVPGDDVLPGVTEIFPTFEQPDDVGTDGRDADGAVGPAGSAGAPGPPEVPAPFVAPRSPGPPLPAPSVAAPEADGSTGEDPAPDDEDPGPASPGPVRMAPTPTGPGHTDPARIDPGRFDPARRSPNGAPHRPVGAEQPADTPASDRIADPWREAAWTDPADLTSGYRPDAPGPGGPDVSSPGPSDPRPGPPAPRPGPVPADGPNGHPAPRPAPRRAFRPLPSPGGIAPRPGPPGDPGPEGPRPEPGHGLDRPLAPPVNGHGTAESAHPGEPSWNQQWSTGSWAISPGHPPGQDPDIEPATSPTPHTPPSGSSSKPWPSEPRAPLSAGSGSGPVVPGPLDPGPVDPGPLDRKPSDGWASDPGVFDAGAPSPEPSGPDLSDSGLADSGLADFGMSDSGMSGAGLFGSGVSGLIEPEPDAAAPRSFAFERSPGHDPGPDIGRETGQDSGRVADEVPAEPRPRHRLDLPDTDDEADASLSSTFPGPATTGGVPPAPSDVPEYGLDSRLTPNEQELLRRLQEELAAREGGEPPSSPRNGSPYPGGDHS